MGKWMLFGLFIFIIGCGKLFGGPSEEDVNIAMEAIMQGFQASISAEPEMQEVYVNAADITFTLDDGAIVHEMSFIINDDGTLKTAGSCTYNDYNDKHSNYLINGEFSYRLVFTSADRPDKMHGEMDLNFDLQGGKIETLEVFFAMNEQGQFEDALLIANGHEIDFDKWQKVINLLEPLINKKPG